MLVVAISLCSFQTSETGAILAEPFSSLHLTTLDPHIHRQPWRISRTNASRRPTLSCTQSEARITTSSAPTSKATAAILIPAVTKASKNGAPLVIKLDFLTPEHTSDTVRVYIAYLKSGPIEPVSAQSPANREGPFHTGVASLIDGYLVAFHLDDTKGQNDIMDATLAAYRDESTVQKRWLPSPATLTKVYNQTGSGSRMRRLMVDMHIWAGHIGEFNDDDYSDVDVHILEKEFFDELSTALDKRLFRPSNRGVRDQIQNEFKHLASDKDFYAGLARDNHAADIFPKCVKIKFSACAYHDGGTLTNCHCEETKRKRAANNEAGRASKR